MSDNFSENDASKLEEKLKEYIVINENPVRVIFCQDISGSMIDVLHIAKKCWQLIIERLYLFGHESRTVALVSFAGGPDMEPARINCGFTSDAREMAGAIEKMTHDCGALTFTWEALKLIATLASHQGLVDAETVVIVATDGGSQNIGETLKNAYILREKHKCKIFCLAVGTQISIREVRGIASPGCDFYIRNWDALSDMFNRMVMPHEIPKLKTKSRTSYSFDLVGECEPFFQKTLEKIEVVVKTLGPNGIEKKYEFKNMEFTLSDLVSGTTYDIKFRYYNKGSKIGSRWSLPLTWSTMAAVPSSGYYRDENTMAEFCKSVLDRLRSISRLPYGIPAINIAIVGAMGGGKSSVASGMCRGLEDVPVFGVGNDPLDHFTTAIGARKIPKYPIILWDTWGSNDTKTNYQGNTFPFFCRGYLKKGYKMQLDKQVDLDNDQNVNREPTIHDHMHVCIFVLDEVCISNFEIVKRINSFYQQCCRENIEVLFLLTKMDRCDQDLTDPKNLKNIHESEQVRSRMKEFCKNANVPMHAVLPIVNYFDGESDCLAKNVMVLDLLSRAYDMAMTTIEKLVEKGVTVPFVLEPIPTANIHICEGKSELGIVNFDVSKTIGDFKKHFSGSDILKKFGDDWKILNVYDSDVISECLHKKESGEYYLEITEDKPHTPVKQVGLALRDTKDGVICTIENQDGDLKLTDLTKVIHDQTDLKVKHYYFSGPFKLTVRQVSKLALKDIVCKDQDGEFIIIEIHTEENSGKLGTPSHICCICSERPHNTRLKCTHSFCMTCITKGNLKECALCRAPVEIVNISSEICE